MEDDIVEMGGDESDGEEEKEVVVSRNQAAAFPAVGEFKKFYYFKEHVVDTVIPYIVNSLLGKRKEVRKQMEAMCKDCKTAQEKKAVSESLDYRILDRRQNSFKIAANSIYGLVGSSYGGHKITAACVTAMSRHLIKLCNKTLVEDFDAFIVYNDTDSVFFKFNSLADLSEHEQIVQTHKICDEKVLPGINEMCRQNGYKYMNFDKEKVGRGLFFTKKKYVFEDYDANGKYVKTLNTGDACVRRNYTLATKMLYKSLIPMFFESKNITHVNQYVVWFLLSLLLGNLDRKLLLSSVSVKDIGPNSKSSMAKSIHVANSLDANIKESARFYTIPTILPHPSLANTSYFDPKKAGHLQTVYRIFDERMLINFLTCLTNMNTPIGLLYKCFAEDQFNPVKEMTAHSFNKVATTNIKLPGSAIALNFMLSYWNTPIIPGVGARRAFIASIIFQCCLDALEQEMRNLMSHLSRSEYLFSYGSLIIMSISLVLTRFVNSEVMKILNQPSRDKLVVILRNCAKIATYFDDKKLVFTDKKTPKAYTKSYSNVVAEIVEAHRWVSQCPEPVNENLNGITTQCVERSEGNLFKFFDCWKDLIEVEPKKEGQCTSCRLVRCPDLRR